MKKISRSALLPYSAKQMYDLVNDVVAYPEFLPWCGGSKVIKKTTEGMIAEVTIAKAGLSKTFTTENVLVENKSINLTLVDGPFSSLVGDWQFQVLDKTSCKINFEVQFQVNSGVVNAAIGSIFEMISTTFVDSFSKRAKQIYDVT